jgi:hypothetical protein
MQPGVSRGSAQPMQRQRPLCCRRTLRLFRGVCDAVCSQFFFCFIAVRECCSLFCLLPLVFLPLVTTCDQCRSWEGSDCSVLFVDLEHSGRVAATVVISIMVPSSSSSQTRTSHRPLLPLHVFPCFPLVLMPLLSLFSPLLLLLGPGHHHRRVHPVLRPPPLSQ